MNIKEDLECGNRGKMCSTSCGSFGKRPESAEFSPINQKELTEECPLKLEKCSACKVANNYKGGFQIMIFSLIIFSLILVAIFGVLILNLLVSKKSSVVIVPILRKAPKLNPREKHGSVASDFFECSKIGTNLLLQGGNAIDAAVGATICMSVVAPHKTGLGGGGKIMIYSHRDRKNPLIVDFASNTNSGIFSSAKIRVPGFLRGLEFAQSLRGKLPWSKIVEPAARLAKIGFFVTDDFAREIAKSVEHGMIFGHLRSGEILKLPDLGETLEAVGRFGCDIFYNGTLTQKVLRDAVIKEQLFHQLSEYEPLVYLANKTKFHNHAIYLSSFRENVFLSSIEKLEELNIYEGNASTLEAQILAAKSLVHSIAGNHEILKHLERERYSSVCVMDHLDIYVSVVTGLSAPLGLLHMTGAGFLLDGVDDDNNFDSLSPIIFHDEKNICELRGIFGTDDPLLVAQILYNLLLRSLNLSTAIEYPRFHLFPDGISMENSENRSVNPSIRAQLESLLPLSHVDLGKLSKSVNAITKVMETITSHSDTRGNGRASEY